jgi:trans-aconitate methyltransferase
VHDGDRQGHWDGAYSAKGEAGVSWFENRPTTSLELIEEIGGTPVSTIIDIGGGASRLVDVLIEIGWQSIAVLDVAGIGLAAARARLGTAAERVEWIVADVTKWRPSRSFDIWHDRAAFHFLVDPADRAAYVERLRTAVKPGGHAIIATFAPDGPERCSGLAVQRYDAESLAAVVGTPFELVRARRQTHSTPWGSTQSFQYSVLRRTEG